MRVLVDGYGATLGDVAAMLNDRENLLIWGRGYGLRLHLIIQNLPGQRQPETLAMIEKTLGEQSLIAEGDRSNHRNRARPGDGRGGRPIGGLSVAKISREIDAMAEAGK